MNKNKLASWGNIVKNDLEKDSLNKSSLSKLDIEILIHMETAVFHQKAYPK